MKFETVWLYFLCEFSVCCHANFATMAMWQRLLLSPDGSTDKQIEGGGEVASNLSTIQASTWCCNTARILSLKAYIYNSSHLFSLLRGSSTVQLYRYWTEVPVIMVTGPSCFDCSRISSAGRLLDCRAGGQGFNSWDRTDTQALKMTEEWRYCLFPANG